MLVRGILFSLAGLALLLYLWLNPEPQPLSTIDVLATPMMAAAALPPTVAALPPPPLWTNDEPRESYCLWPDDTLGGIAAAAGVEVQAILDANPDYTGYAGSSIFLPAGSIPPQLWTTPKPMVPTIAALPFGVSGYYISYDNREKRVALSFDIGYVPENHEFMRWLADQGIRATFLVMGDPVTRYPEIVNHILDNGHELGNHSFTHDNMLAHSASDIAAELIMTEKAVQDARPGATTKPLFRAPFGAINSSIVRIAHEEGFQVVGWTVDSRDWNENITAEQIYVQVTRSICPGAIVALHDINPESQIALPHIIDYLRRAGYSFATVSELIFPPGT